MIPYLTLLVSEFLLVFFNLNFLVSIPNTKSSPKSLFLILSFNRLSEETLGSFRKYSQSMRCVVFPKPYTSSADDKGYNDIPCPDVCGDVSNPHPRYSL